MQELEKILEEIEKLKEMYKESSFALLDKGNLPCEYDKSDIESAKVQAISEAIAIIRKHMPGKDTNVPTNDGCNPVDSEPEERRAITKTIKGLMFLKEKLYNGIYADRLDCIDYAISALREIQQYREIGASPERITELILEGSAAKRILGHYQKIGTVEECWESVYKRKAFCDSAEKCADGKCVGYGKSEMDDEPIEMCKRCKSYVGFEESE